MKRRANAAVVFRKEGEAMPHTVSISLHLRQQRSVLASLPVFVLGLGLAGCHTAVSDSTLTANVKSAFAGDPSIQQQPIQVATQNGIVTLTGNVSDNTASSVAAQDAARVKGVKEVVDSLTIAGAPVTATVTSPSAPTQARPATAQEQQSLATGRPLPPPPGGSPAAGVPAQSAPPAPVERAITAPAGTGISIRITEALSSQTSHDGEPFNGTVTRDVVADGFTVIPSGSAVSGRVIDAKDAGHFKGHSLLSIELTSVRRHGEVLPLATDAYTVEGKNRGKNSAEKIGGGAAVGALLGGIFGGGKGAGIGALAGGGGGTVLQGVTRGQQVSIPSESAIRFRLERSITVHTAEQPSRRDEEGLHTR